MNPTQALIGSTLYGVGSILVDIGTFTDVSTKAILKATKFNPNLDASIVSTKGG
jgi:hypothetical protein